MGFYCCVCVCVLALQKKAIQKSNKDIEKEAEDGTVYTDNTEISFTNFMFGMF